MAIKPDGGLFLVREQIFSDRAMGLQLQFYSIPSDTAHPLRLRLFGDVACGDHELIFDANGIIQARQTFLNARGRPSWLRLA